MLYSALDVSRNIVKGEAVDWLAVIICIASGKASTPFYYILVLLQLTVLAPIIIRIVQERKTLYRAMWWLTPVYLLVIYYDNIVNGGTFDRFGTPFVAWFIFFFLGLSMRMYGSEWIRYARKFGRWYYVLGALVLSILEGEILVAIGCKTSFASSQIRFTTFLYALTIIMFLYRKSNESKGSESSRLSIVGDYSYGIFYIHCIVLMFVNKAVSILGVDDLWIVVFAINFILTAVVSVAVVGIVRRLMLPNKVSRKMLKMIGF